MGSPMSAIPFLKLVDVGVFLVVGMSRSEALFSLLIAVFHAPMCHPLLLGYRAFLSPFRSTCLRLSSNVSKLVEIEKDVAVAT